jgi:hypothetical protein
VPLWDSGTAVVVENILNGVKMSVICCSICPPPSPVRNSRDCLRSGTDGRWIRRTGFHSGHPLIGSLLERCARRDNRGALTWYCVSEENGLLSIQRSTPTAPSKQIHAKSTILYFLHHTWICYDNPPDDVSGWSFSSQALCVCAVETRSRR